MEGAEAVSKRKPEEGRYSKVSRRVWGSPDFRALSAPKPNAQTLWLRLLTGPELGVIPGLFEARESGLAEALGWPLTGFRRCFAEITTRQMATHDKAAGLMWVPRAIHHNPPDNPNVILGWKLAWKELPDSPLKEQAKSYLRQWCEGVGISWVKAFDNVTGYVVANVGGNPLPNPLGAGSGKQEQEKEQEQEQEQDPPYPPRPDERFAMHPGWRLSVDMRGTLETEMIPGWALDELETRARVHYGADKTDRRSDLDWNRAVAKWARGDWKDPKKRPKQPEPEAARPAEELPPWLA